MIKLENFHFAAAMSPLEGIVSEGQVDYSRQKIELVDPHLQVELWDIVAEQERAQLFVGC